MLREKERRKWTLALQEDRSIAPLAVLRITFGALLFWATLRSIAKGWVYDFYVAPSFYFPFYGFEWVKPLGERGMYLLFGTMALSSLCIMLGLFYRWASWLFFLSFTYVELIDKTYYLNHYYFVSVISFLLIWVPAHRHFSLDVVRNPSLRKTTVPAWTILIFQAQLVWVYFLAGIAKLNPDWLWEAMPLRIWLRANSHLPLVGPLLAQPWVAYIFSWFAAAYDLCIGYFLLKNKTRNVAYFVVVVFHVCTACLFHIGLFPYLMICCALVFFPTAFHLHVLTGIRGLFVHCSDPTKEVQTSFSYNMMSQKFLNGLLFVFFVFQIFLPFRYLLYPGSLFWTEEGFRFSWRVMLMEKTGTAFFYVEDPQTGRKSEVDNSRFLTPLQEKMMATQPDMLLQYAHYLDATYRKYGIQDPIVTVESYVTLNGSGNRLLVDPTVDLSKETENFSHKTWILPFDRP